MAKIGKIISNNVQLEKHEYDTVLFLANNGFDIELIPPSYTKGQHRADIKMKGLEWEIKSPEGRSTRTIEQNFRKAVRQSENIIIDLRRIKVEGAKAFHLTSKQFRLRKNVRRLIIIDKTEKILVFYK